MALPNVHLVYYGEDLEMRGLFLDSLDKINLEIEKPKAFLPGHRYVVVFNDNAKDDSEQPYKIIQKEYGIHYGPRGEGHYDYTMCDYLTTRDKIYFKFIYKRYEWFSKWIEEDEYEGMLPNLEQIKLKIRNANLESGVSKRTGKRWYRFSFERLKDASDDIQDFCNRPDYIKPTQDIKETHRARTIEEINKWFDYFIYKPDNTIFGFDYETAYGFPMESPDFKTMGLGIASCDDDAIGVYFDTQWMQYFGKNGEFELFCRRLREFLNKFENSVVFNNSFEQKVTYLLTGKLNLFDEAATVNKCDGKVYRRFSLKWTVQRCLHLPSWDDDFDLLTGELLPDLFEQIDVEDEEGNITKEYKWQFEGSSKKVFTDSGNRDETGNVIYIEVDNNFRNSYEWKEICKLFSSEVDEFEILLSYNWGEPYACIPSNIHKEYCCRDSYYTGLLKIYALEKYTPLCYQTYNNNLRLEALLHLTGCFIDLPLRNRMELQALWMVIWGNLNIAKWAVHEQLNWFNGIQVPEIPLVTNLIKAGYDPCDSKSILLSHLSETSESGIDEEYIRSLYGEDLTQMMIDYIKEYCFRLDDSYRRARKVYNEINWELTQKFNPDYGDGTQFCKYTIDGIEYKIDLNYDQLTKYYELQDQMKMLVILEKQFKSEDINKLMLPHLGFSNLPDKFYAPKDISKIPSELLEVNFQELSEDDRVKYGIEEWTLDDVMNWSTEVFNYNSIKVSPYMKFMVYRKFKWLVNYTYANDYSKPVPRDQTITKSQFDAVPVESHQRNMDDLKLPWIDDRAKVLIHIDEDNFKNSYAYSWYKLHGDLTYALYYACYEEGLFKTKDSGEKNEKTGEPIMVFGDEIQEWIDTVDGELTNWYDFMLRYMGYWTLSEDDQTYFNENTDHIDVTENSVQGYTKFELSFCMAKKYYKVLGTYLRGHFWTYNCTSNGFDENGVSSQQWEGLEFNRTFMPFYANEKKSKRWSSPWHTIPSKSEVKRIVTCPDGYLLSYFDISGCEIRTISYKSQDPFMMDCYDKGLDPYIEMARRTFLDRADDIDYLKSWRSVFKMILLGCLYGMGVDKLAEMTELPYEEAERTINDLWARCPVMKKFIEEKSQWAMDHLGYVQSALGDVLEMDSEDGEDRAARLGINQFIQNYSSVSLADGFQNILDHSIHHVDEKIPDVTIRPAGVIHDSCQFYFTTTYLFRMNEYYTRHLTDYMYDIHKIYYTFDLELGTNFYDILHMKQLDDHHIEFIGNYISLRSMVDKCAKDGLKFRISSLQTAYKKKEPINIDINGFEFGPEFKPKYYKSIIDEFLAYEMYAKFSEDESKYKMVFEELPGNPGWDWTQDELDSLSGTDTKVEKEVTPTELPTKWKAPF